MQLWNIRGIRRPARCLFLNNLTAVAFDEAGNQIPELQVLLSSLWAEHAKAAGYDVERLIIETKEGPWRIVKNLDGGWNLEVP